MKKQLLQIITFLILLTVLSACSKTSEESKNSLSSVLAADINNLSYYDSIEGFLAAERNIPGYENEIFYVPALPSDKYKLIQVSKRDDIYISVLYQVINPPPAKENLSGYDAERRQTLICQTYLFEDSQTTLEGFLKNGHRQITYNGKTYYLWEEHAGGSFEREIIGYEIVFIRDGKLVFMHLPPADSYENMMQFAEPEKITAAK